MKRSIKVILTLVVILAGSTVGWTIYTARSCWHAMREQVLASVVSGDSGSSRRQYAEELNIGGAITYTTESYGDRVLVVTEREGDVQAGRDLLTYLYYDDAEVRARGFLSINYRVSAEGAEGDRVWVWLNLSHTTTGQEPWWVRDVLA